MKYVITIIVLLTGWYYYVNYYNQTEITLTKEELIDSIQKNRFYD